jgi:hypothetical protein
MYLLVIYLYFRQGRAKFSVLSDSLLTPAIRKEEADCKSLRYCDDRNAPEYAAGMLGGRDTAPWVTNGLRQHQGGNKFGFTAHWMADGDRACTGL